MVLSQPAPQQALRGLERGPYIFATGEGENDTSPYSAEAYNITMGLGDSVIPVVELRVTRDREWVIYGIDPLEKWTTGKGLLEVQDWEQVRQYTWKNTDKSSGLLRLEDFLKTFQPSRLMVIVHNREVAAAKSLVALLGDREEPQVTLIYAPTHRLNRELRKLRPYWYFGADAVMRTQWEVFSALWLEPMAPADFDWLPLNEPGSRANVEPRLQAELERRQIRRLEWLSEVPEELRVNAPTLGFLTNRPKLLVERLRVAPGDGTH